MIVIMLDMIMIVTMFNIITIMLTTSTIQLLQGTPSDRGVGQRQGDEDVLSSHEYGIGSRGSYDPKHPQASSHRGARTDSDLESPDAGD